MPPEQLKVIQQWLNEILATGEIVTEVTEEDMTGILSLLHKGGPMADQPSHWRPVVLLNSMNQLLAYIINERLTELVEHERILTQAQVGFRQNKSTDINACKLYITSGRDQRRWAGAGWHITGGSYFELVMPVLNQNLKL